MLGASIDERLDVLRENLINASVSGVSSSNIEQVIDITLNKIGEFEYNVQINKVVMRLEIKPM